MGILTLPPATVALSLFLVSTCATVKAAEAALAHDRPGESKEQAAGRAKAAPLSTNSTIRDILHHPAFSGFGRRILPWDDRPYDENMPLAEIGSLLPYHTQVRPETVVGSLNRMIDDVGRGRTVFYDIYTEAQKKADPTKEHTGLFFFRGRPGAPFAVIAPGGGFSYVGSLHEGFPYAAEIGDQGYNAFVLKYRVGQGGTVATQDLAAAVSYIVENADTLGIGTEGYSLWGSSAGARMAASIGSHGVAHFGGRNLPKPSAVVMAYTAHSDHSADEPPTFVAVGGQDGIAPPSTMERRVAELRKAGTEVEYRKYENLGHGFGSGNGTNAEGWVTDAVRFWARFSRK
jgi:acetyl esterase/lipase